MEPLSTNVAASIVRGVGRYLRSARPTDVPGGLRRFRSFRPATLLRHRDQLLEALEDEDVRAAMARWLDDARPKLAETDMRNLRLAVERPDGWRDLLASSNVPRARPASTKSGARRESDPELEATRTRARSARDELKRARQRFRVQLDAAESRIADLEKEIARLTEAEASAREQARGAEAAAESARAELERELRKARRDVDKAALARDEYRAEARAARREFSAATRELERMRRRLEELERRPRPQAPRPRSRQKPKKRRPLAVPKGRLPEDPQTLDEWLSTARVRLLVDGYNAARAPGAFGDLTLEGQRERLIDEVFRLAVRRGIGATIVFDGAEVAPGTRRRRRGPVTIEYSRPTETADDHMVALLERLPPDPVIVVTNDRELQERTAAHGATIATSNQLMGLIR